MHEAYIGPIDNTATATHTESDPTPNTVTTAGTAQGRNAELEISKTIVDVEHEHRGDVRYAITVTNNGPDDVITPILILDELESNQGYWSFTVTDQAACAPTNVSISCIADGLAVGETITLNLRTKITSPSDTDYVSNSVRVLAAGVRGGVSEEGVFEAVAQATAVRGEGEPTPEPAPAPPAPSGPLAFTGTTATKLLAVSLLLLTLGGVAVVGARRRERLLVTAEER